MSRINLNSAVESQVRERKRQAVLTRLMDDFPFFAAQCLKIRTKTGEVAPFVLNRPQVYAHGQIEAQRAKIGKVRAIFLKGRQEGMSTYTDGRFTTGHPPAKASSRSFCHMTRKRQNPSLRWLNVFTNTPPPN